jgi:hypothetical protein
VVARLPEVVLAALNSYLVDFITRTKVGGMHLTIVVLEQLPFDQPRRFQETVDWLGCTPSAWIRDRVLELSYTAADLEAFAAELDYTGPPFRWDDQRRFEIRAELDAMFFQLYGLKRDDADYVMDTFPIVREREMKTHGDFRTKRVILEIYDELAGRSRQASRTRRASTLRRPIRASLIRPERKGMPSHSRDRDSNAVRSTKRSLHRCVQRNRPSA